MARGGLCKCPWTLISKIGWGQQCAWREGASQAVVAVRIWTAPSVVGVLEVDESMEDLLFVVANEVGGGCPDRYEIERQRLRGR